MHECGWCDEDGDRVDGGVVRALLASMLGGLLDCVRPDEQFVRDMLYCMEPARRNKMLLAIWTVAEREIREQLPNVRVNEQGKGG